MRSENDDQCSQPVSKSDDDTPKFHKESKMSYTRNLLISLSELDTCKRLPSGLDQSMLGELGSSATGLLHSYRNSDSGRLHGYPSRHLYPNHECGLLGNGASPQATGCVSGASVPVVQGNCNHQLKRSNAAYRPPHLCKAKVHLRADSEDFHNDETFGSSEYLSQEREEEERRRRDSFEVLRKEQQKAFQVKQDKICDEHKENLDPEIGLLLEACGNFKWFINKYSESEQCVGSRSEASDPVGNDFTVKTSASAFLPHSVLESRSCEMNFGTKPLTSSFISEPCDTKRDHGKGYGLHSSGSAHQFFQEKKPAGGVSSDYVKGGFVVYTALNEEVTKQNSTKLSSGRNELTQNLLSSITSSATDEMSEQLHEDFEIPRLQKINERCSTSYLSVKRWGTNYRNGKCPNSVAKRGASQYLSLEGKGLDKADMETSSKLNKGSLDKLNTSEIEGFTEDSQTTEFSGIQRSTVGMITRNDILKPPGFLFPAGGNNNIIPSTVDVSKSVNVNCEGIMSSSHVKKTVVSKIEESLLVSDNTQTKVGFNLRSELGSKFSPVSEFCENGDLIDEICLPDEDSLITVDDCILPQVCTSMAAGDSFDANLFTCSSQVAIADKITSLNPFLVDKRSTQLGLECPIFDSYDVMGLATTYANLHTEQYYPEFGHYQPGKAIFKSSDAQKVQMRSSNSKTHHCNPQPLHQFPSNMLSGPFQHPHADLSWFGHSINSPLPKQMPAPNKFSSPNQVCELSRGSPSPRPIHEMNYYASELHLPQCFPFQYQQQNYRGRETPIPGPIAGGIGNQTVRSGQIHPLAMTGRGSEIFDKQVDKGLWHGQ